MEEEDSQDELINRNVSHGKGKKPAMSILSDEDSEDGRDSVEGETDSEEDDDDVDEEEVLDGVEEEEDEEDESEDEDSGKVLQGAVGNSPADAAALSSDDESEKCPICLNSFHTQPVATPETCEHYFCLDCILEWSQNANSCPVDRIVFNNIFLRKCYGGKVQKTITVQRTVKPGQEEQVDLDLDQTSCEVCGGRDREDRLLLCDGCDAGYHMECLTPPLDAVPVEEWFCPECTANNRNSGSDQVSEEESSALPTTSRSRSRPTRAIARTQQSERVRASINRHRITQARTAAQLAPRYLMQSTWLDETINAVVAGLNTAVYVRDLTPRSRSRRRRKTVRRRKVKSKSSAASGGKATMGVKRRRRRVRRSKSRRKLVIKKETTSRSRIARSLGIKNPVHGSLPSVYRPSENSLGSMRAEIGAASLSVYGDPFDLDPFDDREDEISVPTPSSGLDAKPRGLSRSALRSHRPVARPFSAGLSRRGASIPQMEAVAEEAPVSDLLGSILSGQSMLLMDSSDVVINRDGSLKATKPVFVSSPTSTTLRGSGLVETGNTPNSEGSLIHPTEEAGPSSSPLRRPASAHGSPSSSQNPMSPYPSFHSPHSSPSPAGHPRLNPGAPHRPNALNPATPGNSHLSTREIRDQTLSRKTNATTDSHNQDGTARQIPLKKPPPKPVWVDVSVLPRIPKIKKEGTFCRNGSIGGGSSSLPESSVTSLAGNTSRRRTVDQQGTNTQSQQSRTIDGQRQRHDRAGASSMFSSSFTSTSSSNGASSNSRPSSSSVSFRISSSGSSWHARGLSASGSEEESIMRNRNRKHMQLSSRTQVKEEKNEVYDPFNPTGSDSSDNEQENKDTNVSNQNNESRVTVATNEDRFRQIKSEPMDVDSSDTERDSENCVKVKKETDAFREKPCQIQKPSASPAVDPSRGEAVMAADHSEIHESTFRKTNQSRSSVPRKYISDKVKTEVKSEPEVGFPPVRPQSKSLEESLADLHQDSEGNGVCEELPSVSGACNISNVKKEEKSHESQSKGRKCSPSITRSPHYKDSHKKKQSRSKDTRRSRSRSRDRRRSRSKSKERLRSRSRERKRPRDRRHSSSSSSRERKKSEKRGSRERNDMGRERQKKRSKERRRSRSRSISRSRSRERRMISKERGETLSKGQKSGSRSLSRERKRRMDRSDHKSAEPTSTELKEPVLSANTTKDLFESPSFITKQEMQPVAITGHDLESSRRHNQTRAHKESKEDISLLDESNELCTFKPKEIKQEEPWPVGAIKEMKDIKKEEELCFNSCGVIDRIQDVKKQISEIVSCKESPDLNEMKLKSATLEKISAAYQDDQMKAREMDELPKNIKVEHIWPDEDDAPCCSDNPLVINLDSPDMETENCKKENTESCQSPPSIKMKMETTAPVKQEPVNSSDEDISVDYLIDNLDFIKREMSENSVADSTEAVDSSKPAVQEAPAENKQTTESAGAGAKSKSQGKRVTWNLQEPEGPQSEKMSKLALFKLKLKQEGSRRSALNQQTSSQDKASSHAESNYSAAVSSPPPQDNSIRHKSHRVEVLQDPYQKEKYMKKLHMQERAIEEVKLAIKPFYQKRDISKEEYKEILRKAVQKVCHSKSGEINPVKVANLVKAYVDKYKHARKHKKEETGQSQHSDVPKDDLQTSV